MELPGGDDTEILEAAYRMGHSVTFATSALSEYVDCGPALEAISRAGRVIETNPFSYDQFEMQILAAHVEHPLDAIVCLVDFRLIESARIAARLNLPYMSVDTAVLLRNKYEVRRRLQTLGIPQPDFLFAQNNAEILAAMDQLGTPVLMKPADGFGSQHILVMHTPEELAAYRGLLSEYLPLGGGYGCGARASGQQIIERFMHGRVVGCDTLSINGHHQLLGINEKHFYAPPFFAVRGSIFPSTRFDTKQILEYLFSALDAVDYAHGISHTEIMITSEGPRLVEINGRLVGAGIGKLLSFAYNRSIYEVVIDLHLGDALTLPAVPPYFAATRWVSAPRQGTLKAINFPERSAALVSVQSFYEPGDTVYMPVHNGARLVCVMAKGLTMEEAESAAEDFVVDTHVVVEVSE